MLGGFLALFWGVSQIMLGFSIRNAREEAAAPVGLDRRQGRSVGEGSL
jgi:hypothetical protein